MSYGYTHVPHTSHHPEPPPQNQNLFGILLKKKNIKNTPIYGNAIILPEISFSTSFACQTNWNKIKPNWILRNSHLCTNFIHRFKSRSLTFASGKLISKLASQKIAIFTTHCRSTPPQFSKLRITQYASRETPLYPAYICS